MKNIEWRMDERMYTNQEVGYLGTIPIFRLSYDAINPPPDKPWKLHSNLPKCAIKNTQHFKNTDIAKEHSEILLAGWMTRAGVKVE